jgi:hypothetical protein
MYLYMIYFGDSQTYGDDSLQLFESAGREDSFKKSIISLDKVSIDHNYNGDLFIFSDIW